MLTSVAVAGMSLVVVLLMMLGEWRLSNRHERVLQRRGAIEPPDAVYATMRWAYPGAFVGMALEGAFFGPAPGMMTIAGVVLLAASKILKFWAIATLGERWTYRVLVLPDVPLVGGGPYRLMRHPNYVAVVGELIAMALLAGARVMGPVGTIFFATLLRRRIQAEDRSLGRR